MFYIKEIEDMHVDLNYVALKEVDPKITTLIVTYPHKYVPLFKDILKLKDTKIIETREYMEVLRRYVCDFKNIILVGFELNNFEKELFSQLCEKLQKNIILIKTINVFFCTKQSKNVYYFIFYQFKIFDNMSLQTIINWQNYLFKQKYSNVIVM